MSAGSETALFTSNTASASEKPATRRQAKTCSSDRASIWLARRSDPLSTESALEDRGSGSGTPQPNRYIEGWFSPRRRHSTLGYLSPVDYEQAHQEMCPRDRGQLTA